MLPNFSYVRAKSVGDAVRALTGRAPQSVGDFLAANRSALRA